MCVYAIEADLQIDFISKSTAKPSKRLNSLILCNLSNISLLEVYNLAEKSISGTVK